MLVVATPVRGAHPKTALVTLGYAEFRSCLAVHGRVEVGTEPVRARNRLAAIILQDIPAMRAVLWLDDDEWADDPAIIQRMLDTKEDLVGAPYVKKDYPLEFVHVGLPGAERVGDLLEVKGLGFGFTITSRRCLEKMTAGSRIYTDRKHKRKCANLFGEFFDEVTPGSSSEDDELLSEDLSFCARWRAMGGRAMLWCGGPGHVMHVGGHVFYATNKPG